MHRVAKFTLVCDNASTTNFIELCEICTRTERCWLFSQTVPNALNVASLVMEPVDRFSVERTAFEVAVGPK